MIGEQEARETMTSPIERHTGPSQRPSPSRSYAERAIASTADATDRRVRSVRAAQGPVSVGSERIVPRPPESRNAWLLVAEAGKVYGTNALAITTAFGAVQRAYRADDSAAFSQAIGTLKSTLRQLSPTVYPSEDVLQLMLRSSYETNDSAGTAKANRTPRPQTT